jgi:two-component system NarL family sensor kinase
MAKQTIHVAANMESETLARRNRELSILNSIAEALNRSVDMDQALGSTLAKVAELLGLHTGWIWLLDEETGASYLGAALNLPPALTKNPLRMCGSCYCLDTFRAGDLNGAANVNVVTCSRLKELVDGTDGLRYHASIPLYAHGKRLGVLNVASTDWRQLSPEDLRLLYTVGDLVGMAIERARLFAQSLRLGAEDERNRLARELHDTLAQGLTAIALQLESADCMLDEDSDCEGDRERVQRVVRKALALTRANLEETRRSVQDLRAAPLDGRSLADALAALAGSSTGSHDGQPDVEVTFVMVGESRPLPVRIENGVFRMAQEAVANALRHSGARHITIRLETVPHRLRLLVEDDGRGFDSNTVEPGHYGLVGMNERAKLLGGRLRLHSCDESGTSVDVTIPLEEAE